MQLENSLKKRKRKTKVLINRLRQQVKKLVSRNLKQMLLRNQKLKLRPHQKSLQKLMPVLLLKEIYLQILVVQLLKLTQVENQQQRKKSPLFKKATSK